jgi:hypothetical protein
MVCQVSLGFYYTVYLGENMENKENLEEKKEREPFGGMVKKIGNITYHVNFYFSETSKETVQDKILRLARNDNSYNDKV